MGDSFEPVAIITTLQPVLVIWLLAISFFVTLAVVAVVSKGRRWYELAALFLVIYVVATALGLGLADWVLEISVFEVEVVTLQGG